MRQNKIKKLVTIALVISVLSSGIVGSRSTNAKEIDKVQTKQEERITKTNFKVSNITCEAWGLGKELTEEVNNDRDYDWYVNQYRTGEFSYINCGPTSIEMAMKWLNKDSKVRTEEIRNKFIPNGDGTFSDKLVEILTSYNIKNKEMDNWLNRPRNRKFRDGITEEDKKKAIKIYSSDFYFTLDEQNKMKENIKQEVKNGNLVLVGLYTSCLKVNTNLEQRTGRYYYGDFSHWYVIKGYKVVDDKLYYEVYDPIGGMDIGYEANYEDGTRVAQNRYLLADEVIKSYMYGAIVYK